MKTSLRRIAERYVKALSSLSVERLCVDAVERDLSRIEQALGESREFTMLIVSPYASRQWQEKAIEALLAPLKVHPLTKDVIKMLLDRRRLALLPEIIALFSDWAVKYRGQLKVEAVSSMPLSVKSVNDLEQSLKETLGKEIRLKTSVDASLLGGLVIKIGSTQLDGSLAGKLERLRQKLKAA